MLEICLLGQFDVRHDGASLALQSRPAQSLLARLALSPGVAFRRERLAGELWPDASERNARSNLRHALWRIRSMLHGTGDRALEEAFVTDQITMRFVPQAGIHVDAAAMAGALDDPRASTGRLIEAAALYQGELLPGFYDDWVGMERMRVQAVYDLLMQRLLDRLSDDRRWRDAVRWGLHWFTHGEELEAACRSVMQAHSALGNPGGVKAAYRRCADQLQRQLGVPPSAETAAVHAALSQPRPTPAGLGARSAVYAVAAHERPHRARTPERLLDRPWHMRGLLGFEVQPSPTR